MTGSATGIGAQVEQQSILYLWVREGIHDDAGFACPAIVTTSAENHDLMCNNDSELTVNQVELA